MLSTVLASEDKKGQHSLKGHTVYQGERMANNPNTMLNAKTEVGILGNWGDKSKST